MGTLKVVTAEAVEAWNAIGWTTKGRVDDGYLIEWPHKDRKPETPQHKEGQRYGIGRDVDRANIGRAYGTGDFYIL